MATTNNEVWGALAFRGILAVLFGIAAVFWPGLTLLTLVYLFSAFVLATGLITLVLGLSNAYSEGGTLLGRVLEILVGVFEIGVGVYLLRHTDVSLRTFLVLIGFVLIVRGIIEFFSGLFEVASASVRTFSVVTGVIAVVAGVIILVQPVSSGIAFVWILGLYALVTGPMLIALAMDRQKQVL